MLASLGLYADPKGRLIRRAQAGHFRVVAEQQDSTYEALVHDWPSMREAVMCAEAHDNEKVWCFVYDDQGVLVWAKQGKSPRKEGLRGKRREMSRAAS